jgi:hypothetical protein
VPVLVLEPLIERELLDRRRACRGDRFDEVWEGVYVLSPFVNIEHQAIMGQLGLAFTQATINWAGVRVFLGVNVSDQRVNWD